MNILVDTIFKSAGIPKGNKMTHYLEKLQLQGQNDNDEEIFFSTA